MSRQVPPTLGDIFEDMDKAVNTFFGKYLPEQKGEPMTEKEYNEIDAVRRSDLMKIRKSPLHYKWAKEHPEEEESTPSQIFGAAAHKYLLELGSFYDEYALAPNVDKRTKAGKEEWERFKAENEGKTVITSDDLDKLWLMQEAVCDHKGAKELLSGTIETPILWTDPETGIECKIRPDVVAMKDGRPIIVDYKTVTSCDERTFWRECDKYGYQLQAGMYTEGYALTNYIEVGFAFVAQEKTAPYACRVFYCDPEFIEQGNEEYHQLLRYLKQCQDTNFWPGYSDGYLMPYQYKEVAE